MSINYVTSTDNGVKKLLKRGGGLPKVHMVFRGVIQKSTMVGRGGQKCPKIGPHGLRMPPRLLLVTFHDNNSRLH